MSLDLRHAVFAFVAFILGLLAGNIWRPIPPDVKAWEARVVAYQRDSVVTEKVIATLHGTVARLEDSARTLTNVAAQAKRDAERSKRKADTVYAQLPADTTTADSLKTMTAAYEARTEEATNWRQAYQSQVAATGRLIAALDTSKAITDSLTKRLAIADDLLRDRPVMKRCSFICPSPTTTFVIGAALGVVAATRFK